MINCAAYRAGAAQKLGKMRKIDFFVMHNVTCSIFFTVLAREPWISIEDKLRLVEWELRGQDILEYEPTSSKGMDWRAMYKAVNEEHDDGHVAKFIRALKNGEDVSKPFEQGEGAAPFPSKGNMWFKIAQMAYDSTTGIETFTAERSDKWLWAPDLIRCG